MALYISTSVFGCRHEATSNFSPAYIEPYRITASVILLLYNNKKILTGLILHSTSTFTHLVLPVELYFCFCVYFGVNYLKDQGKHYPVDISWEKEGSNGQAQLVPFPSMPTSECRCCVCTTYFCLIGRCFQSVTGLHTSYLILQEQTEANSSSEDMDTQMANKGKYYKTHTVKTKVVLDFLFRKVKTYILSQVRPV